MQLVWDKQLPQSRKFLLLALADQANDAGECWPSVRTLAARCSMGRRTVFDSLADLESEGWLSREAMPSQRVKFCLNIAQLQQLPLDPEARNHPAYQAGWCGGRTGAKSAPVRNPHQRGIGTGADPANTGAKSALHKATPSKSNPHRGGRGTREEQLQVMGSYDSALIEPYLSTLPDGIDLQVFADFVKHRQVKGGPMSISSWNQVLARLEELAAAGVDLNQSLRETMLLNLAKPVDPRPKSRAGPTRPRANDDFSHVRYQGTDDEHLPAELRSDTPA